MDIKLRGHHLLCLLGYRGMGYSEAFAANMTVVYERLRQQPTTLVTIVSGPDDLCVCFPSDQPNHCLTGHVHERDEHIRQQLGLNIGDCVPWQHIVDTVRLRVKPQHIPEWCGTCPWLSYGVCEEGVGRIANGDGLSVL
jgi:hypothetical protein